MQIDAMTELDGGVHDAIKILDKYVHEVVTTIFGGGRGVSSDLSYCGRGVCIPSSSSLSPIPNNSSLSSQTSLKRFTLVGFDLKGAEGCGV